MPRCVNFHSELNAPAEEGEALHPVFDASLQAVDGSPEALLCFALVEPPSSAELDMSSGGSARLSKSSALDALECVARAGRLSRCKR